MIITRTPFRVSFVGGGTDLPDFYRKHTGAVVSTAIDKYMYIIVNRRFDDTVRVSYSKTEIVSDASKVNHPIVREALNLVGIENGIEIVSVADVPASTGLGSSSSFTVGLLNALFAYQGIHKSAEDLAQLACYIEIDVLKEPIGKQDQYAAAYGGFNYIQFNRDDSVFVEPLPYKNSLSKNLLLFHIDGERKGRTILAEQKANIPAKTIILSDMQSLAKKVRLHMIDNQKQDNLGMYLGIDWILKKQLSSRISNKLVDQYYITAMNAGAYGGKLCGEGGNGFLLIYCPEDNQRKVIKALHLPCYKFNFEPEGSKIVYTD